MAHLPFDIAFYEAFEEEAQAIRHFLPKTVNAYFTEKTIQDEAGALIAPLISVRTQSLIPQIWAAQLQGIITRSTGYDTILRYRQQTGIKVAAGHLPRYCNRAVAEQAMLLWMALLRKLPRQLEAFSRFQRNGLSGLEAKGRNLVVIGVGCIGYEVVAIGRALGMTAIGVDIRPDKSDVDYLPLDEALRRADVIVCAMNLTADNPGYFSRARWSRVKAGAVFVNISRGELSPFVDLQFALEQGYLSAIALDVFNEESNVAGFLRRAGHTPTTELAAFEQLREDSRVIFTPHNAFNTQEAVTRKASQTIEQLVHWQAHQVFKWPL